MTLFTLITCLLDYKGKADGDQPWEYFSVEPWTLVNHLPLE